MPPAYPAEDFVVPEGVVGIFKGAFDGCHFVKCMRRDATMMIQWIKKNVEVVDYTEKEE